MNCHYQKYMDDVRLNITDENNEVFIREAVNISKSDICV